jgi:hypothetical protein
MPVIQLYCLQCNRPNDAASRFCSGCGTGLIRKFCPRCHALNGAESHFCHACGMALPLPPGLAAPEPDAQIPSLTDAVEMPELSLLAHSPIEPLWAQTEGHSAALVMPAVAMALTSTPPALPTPRPTHRWGSPVQLALVGALGAGAVLALAAAVSLWPRHVEHSAAAVDNARPAPGPRPRGDAAADAPTVVPMRDTRATTAGRPEAVVDKPLVDSPAAARSGIDAALAHAQKALGGTTAAPRMVGVAAATTSPAGVARARTVTPAAPTPSTTHTPDCTPEVYALGLCAPGARIIGRP